MKKRSKRSKAHRNVDDPPYAALPVTVEDSANLLWLSEVAEVNVNLRAVLLHVGRIFGKVLFCQLGNTDQCVWMGIMIIVDGNDFEAAGFL